jgi:hypothetical protein
MAYPFFTEIETDIYDNINSIGEGNQPIPLNRSANATSHYPWLRLISGGGTNGCIMYSNPDVPLIMQTTEVKDKNGKVTYVNSPSSYGNQKESGMIGYDWKGNPIYPDNTIGIGNFVLKPSPVITGLEIKEGKDQISREGNLTIKCFSLGQCEAIQKYFMEPGHSLLVEYGWASNQSLKQLIDVTTSPGNIPKLVADANLNQDALHKKRKDSKGEYDSFFGFIVGGNTTSEGDTFTIVIKLRGMPGLPTFLQLQKNINPIVVIRDAKGKKLSSAITAIPTTTMFGESEINVNAGKDGLISGERRYKWMFNDLPAVRQTPAVKAIVKKVRVKNTDYGYWDLVNFDYYVYEQLKSFSASGWTFSWPFYQGSGEIQLKDATISKDKVVSKNRYINFALAIEILNSNNGLTSYQVGEKQIDVKISSKGQIGAFPGMFSTRPSKLLIPGKIPNFYSFYLSSDNIDANEILKESNFIDNSIYGKAWVYSDTEKKEVLQNYWYSFVQNNDLIPPKGVVGHNEVAGYWGRIEYLYINFDLFSNVIKNSANKSIREVLMELLNEMSAAVNSFWNFQLVEKVGPTGDITIGIIDENWGGKNVLSPKLFAHSGEASKFLEADLDINIPAEMTNALILRRLDYTSNPDAHILKPIGAFSEYPDKFLTKVNYTTTLNDTNDGSSTKDAATKKVEDLKAQIEAQKKSFRVEVTEVDQPDFTLTTYTYYNSADDEVYSTQFGSTYYAKTSVGEAFKKLNDDLKAAEDEVKNNVQMAVENNLKKIDVLPNPWNTSVNSNALQASAGFTAFNNNFKIYCCDDTQLFDILKNNAFESYPSDKTSPPLPIKYSFKILGKSGLRRGDIFNIAGIPRKYAQHGFFQIVNIEQNIAGGSWTTYITGQYRQNIKK